MSNLSEYDLVVIGKPVINDGEKRYMGADYWEHLSGMSNHFRSLNLLCREVPLNDRDRTSLSEIDTAEVSFHTNTSWNGAVSTFGKVTGTLRSLRNLHERRHRNTITYLFLPGMYPFLLMPAAVSVSDVSLAHFGSEAVGRAAAVYGDSIPGRLKTLFYQYAQEYALNYIDVITTLDGSLLGRNAAADLRLSKPFADVTPVDPLPDLDSDLGTPVKLLYVASFRPYKGHKHLIDAVDSLTSSTDRDFELCLVGDGPKRSEIETYAESLGHGDCVRFTGYVSDKELVREYENADIFIMPSLDEGGPQVVLEAAFIGLPIISTEVGLVRSVFTDDVDVLKIEKSSPKAIEEAIRELARNRSLRETIASNARESVQWFAEGNPTDQCLEILRSKIG